MDPAAILGIVVAFAAIMISNVLEGGNPAHLFAPAALILIFVGTLSVSMSSTTLPGTIGAIKWMIYGFTAKKVDMNNAIEPLIKMAEKARREGLLALESEIESIEDEFMKRGLQLAVDGTDPDDLYEILSAEVKAMKAAAVKGATFWSDAGAYSPTIGIIGTCMGLIHALGNLDKPEKLGEMIAAAFLATLWGIMSANVMFLAWGKRIKACNALEANYKEIIIDGVLAIQAGANPRVVATKLRSKIVADVPGGPPAAKEAA
ncbi:MAG: MotA/TolQ/ExbB proton channel family protein [Kineosporiaceae bacterium]